MTRRDAMRTGAVLAPIATAGCAASPEAAQTLAADAPVQTLPLQLSINGKTHSLRVDSRTTLLDALREHLQLTGSKKGCDHGQCGACTVLLDGRRINACLTLAVMHDGQAITTIEGLAGAPDTLPVAGTAPSMRTVPLHPLQAAFIKHDGFQCGYCTPGQICSAAGMLSEARSGMPSHVTGDLNAAPGALSEEEIRERMSGNLCRCSAYPNIVAAIKEVASAGNGAVSGVTR